MHKKLLQNLVPIYDKNKTKQNKTKTLQKVGIEENCLNIIKVIYEKSTANIILEVKT